MSDEALGTEVPPANAGRRVRAGVPLRPAAGSDPRAVVRADAREASEEALKAQIEKGGRLGEVLIGMKAVSEEDVTRALAAQLDLPYLGAIGVDDIDTELRQARARSTSPNRHASFR